MTNYEFCTRLPDGTRAPTDKDFDVIQFVYDYHPSIDCTNGKDQIARLYSEFGMRIIWDMFDTAKRAQEIANERRHLRLQLEKLDKEYSTLKQGGVANEKTKSISVGGSARCADDRAGRSDHAENV